jgi:hypothetical protein
MIGLFKFKGARLSTDYKSQENILTLIVDKDSNIAVRQLLNELDENATYIAEIKKSKRKRTLDQNAYMWVLCQRIAEKVGNTKEEVYRHFIKAKGQFDMLCIQNKALESFMSRWGKQGIGWFCETDKSKLNGCTNVICYYGTSTYTTEEMKILLDEVISQCKELNISTVVDGYKE